MRNLVFAEGDRLFEHKRMRATLKIAIFATGVFVACVVLVRELPSNVRSSFGRDATSAAARAAPSIPLHVANAQSAPDSDSSPHEGSVEEKRDADQSSPLPSTRIDKSVIGIAFPVSPSVDASCKRKNIDLCERQHHALVEMAMEPRDEAWATRTEVLIQDEVQSQGSGTYSIRNIECRSSICAIEVQSPSGAYVGATYDFLVSNNLVDGLRIVGTPETDSSGHQISVALVIFVKFSHYL